MIFDYIAETARILLDEGDKHFFEEYLAMSSAHKKDLETLIKKKIPDLYDSKALKQLDSSELSVHSNVSKQIISFITDAKSEKNYLALMELMVTVCNSLLNYVKGLGELTVDYSPINYLNSNHEDTKVIVLPYFICDWQHDNMRTHFENSINNYINNIYIIDIKYTIGKYKIQNYIVDRKLFHRAKHNKKLKIGVSPLTSNPVITQDSISVEYKNNIGYFSVKEVKDSESINKSLISILQKAREESVDILVFPEMLGTEDTKIQFEEFCLEHMLDPDQSNPDIVVLPTIWKNHQNQAYVYIGELNKPIIQKKYYRFPYPNNDDTHLLEDLDISEKPVINVFHSKQIGRIVVAICKDLLMKEHIDFLIGDLKASLILVPSFSTGDYSFKMISYYGYPYDCNIVWINTCAVEHILPDGKVSLKTVGMMYNPSKFTELPCNPTLEKDSCEHHCTDCLKTFEIKLKGD